MATCPKCGSLVGPVHPGMWVEDVLVSGDSATKQVIHTVQRSLFGYCPVHGKVVYKKFGHHSGEGKKNEEPIPEESVGSGA
jgi:hypothetical protein